MVPLPDHCPVAASLPKYTGQWTEVQVRHLLRRTTFGLTLDRIDEIVSLGLEGAVDHLLRDLAMPAPPLNEYDSQDAAAPIGTTWIDKTFDRNAKRNESFASSTVQLMMDEGSHIREKLTLFWHNHFVVANQQDARFIYDYSTRLRRNALGNFRTFVQEITVCPGMLRYLNGRDNRRVSPNENYARELMELFTVGKGPLAAPGDYTTFTEEDVRAIAVALTGWRDTGHASRTIAEIGVEFRANQHDTTDKQLSHRFGNAVIQDNGAEEYKDVIDALLTSDAVGKHIVTELYRFFVHYDIDETVEAEVILPLAQLFRESDYEIKPLLRGLLTSAAFYDDCVIGTMIRNPLDFLMHATVTLPMALGAIPRDEYFARVDLLELSFALQMEVYNHPDVAGWKAYYQAPSYYQLWINSVTLPIRTNTTDALIEGNAQDKTGIKPVSFIKTLSDPYDPNTLIADLALLLYPRPLTEKQLASLKEVLIPGLPDFEWTVEYADYRQDEEDFNKYAVIESKLKQLLTAMLRFPEFNLS